MLTVIQYKPIFILWTRKAEYGVVDVKEVSGTTSVGTTFFLEQSGDSNQPAQILPNYIVVIPTSSSCTLQVGSTNAPTANNFIEIWQ